MSDQKHNGWTNYETWAVALWMDNEEPSYNYWRETAEGIVKHALDADEATYKLMETIKEEHEQVAPDLGSTVFADLLGAALGEVNWHEIAKHLVDEVAADIAADANA
jgi:hypothetical protein